MRRWRSHWPRSWTSRSTAIAIPMILVEGPDFLASPRISPDGTTLAWLEWDHPDMPWDAHAAPHRPDPR